MNAGEVKSQLTLESNIDLTGSTVTLTMIDPTGAKGATPLALIIGTSVFIDTISGSSYQANFWAYRLTLGTDFPLAGVYTVQMSAVYPDTSKRICNVTSITVGRII